MLGDDCELQRGGDEAVAQRRLGEAEARLAGRRVEIPADREAAHVVGGALAGASACGGSDDAQKRADEVEQKASEAREKADDAVKNASDETRKKAEDAAKNPSDDARKKAEDAVKNASDETRKTAEQAKKDLEERLGR